MKIETPLELIPLDSASTASFHGFRLQKLWSRRLGKSSRVLFDMNGGQDVFPLSVLDPL